MKDWDKFWDKVLNNEGYSILEGNSAYLWESQGGERR